MNDFMPDIPRFLHRTCRMACVHDFILPLKKRMDKTRTLLMMTGALAVQSIFLVATGNLLIYFWIPCMVIAVILMIGFIYGCCDVGRTDAVTLA